MCLIKPMFSDNISPVLFRIQFKGFSRFLMQTTFTNKLLLEGWDRTRFGFKPHSEC